MEPTVLFKALAGLAAIPQLFRRDPEAGFHLGRAGGRWFMPHPFMFPIYSANTARAAVLGLLTLHNQPRLLFRQQGGDFLKSQEENMTETFEMSELMGKGSRRSWSCPGVSLGLCLGSWFVPPLSPAGLRGAGRGRDI